ncbi:tripartite motif-containing protein 2-like [Mizuhopecten yessoensis]|uniref:tripartite motif-containing protein 2-like n=1 Tax=Mizuhopecten yessoensis TaxID=6573 RepID=UPI000B45A15B|nr:tripartite motif-containing protein 2-like [Mizuhopecten yessoensis]
MANRAVSAMSLRTQIQEDYLTCAICFSPFDRPKALPCIHTFCLDCLRDFVTSRGYENSGKFPCPVCREEATLPSEGVSGFPDNYYITSLKDTVAKPARPAPPRPVGDPMGFASQPPNITAPVPVPPSPTVVEGGWEKIPSEKPGLLYPSVSQMSTVHEIPSPPCDQSGLPCTAGMMLKFGKWAPTINDFQKPYGLTVGENGEFVITDRGTEYSNRVLVFSKSGELLSRFVCTGKQTIKVASVAMTPDNNIMVAVDNSPGNAIMQEYNFDGKLLKSYGDFYRHDKPSGIAISSKNHVAISNLEGNNVLLFTEQRKFSTKFGWKGSGDNHFMFPQFVACNHKDYIIVSDSGNDCIKVFDAVGNFKRKFGESGTASGCLSFPMGIAIDSNNNIVVADAGNFRVEIFTSKGQHIRTVVKDTDLISSDVKPLNVAITRGNNIAVLFSGPQFAEVRVYRWGGGSSI